MKNLIASSMILLLLFSANSYSQNWINAGNFPSDYFSGYQGGHGIAVDPDGKLWVQFYDASEYVYDPISDTWIPCRAVYVFNSDGTPASFSPITAITINGITDLLTASSRGLRADNNGNILVSSWDKLYRINYQTGEGMNKAQPIPGMTLTAAAASDAGDIFVAPVLPGLPIVMLDTDFNFLGYAVDATVGYSRSLECSSDGNTIYFPSYFNKTVTIYKRIDPYSPFEFYGTILDGISCESITRNKTTDNLWLSGGSYFDPPTPGTPYSPNTWYEYNISSNQIIDSLKWKFAYPGSEWERPRGLAFSSDNLTAYITCFGDFYYPIVQKYVNVPTIKWAGESFDNAVGNLFSDPPIMNENFWSSSYNSIFQLTNDPEHYEGTGSMKLDYSVEANEFWGGWVVRTTYNPLIPNVMPYLDLSDGTHLSLWFKVTDPAIFTQEGSAQFEFKLAEYNNLGQRDLWIQATSLDITDISGGWINILIPLIQTYDPYTGFAYQMGEGDAKLQLDKIKGFEIAVVYLTYGDPYTPPNMEGSFLIDDLKLTVEVKAALNQINLMINYLTLNDGLKNSLTKKIDQAIINYDKGKLNVVRNVLSAFIDQINSLITEGKLYYDDVKNLIDYCELILEDINHSLAKIPENGVSSDPSDVEKLYPDQFALNQNYPNPFNPTTSITYALPQSGSVTLKVFDILGKEVTTLVNEVKSAGVHSVTFNASTLPSGIYLYKIQSGSFVEVKKMNLIK